MQHIVLTATIPDWITAFSTVFGLLFAAIATIAAWKSFRAQNRQLESQYEEIRQADAGTMQAWWVNNGISGADGRWGVLISNASNHPFHDITVRTVGNRHGECISLKLVPPGSYFVQTITTRTGAGQGWDTPETVSDPNEYTAVSYSEKHAVTSIKFKDGSGTAWTWDQSNGLNRTPA